MPVRSRPIQWGLAAVSLFNVLSIAQAQDAEVFITAQRFAASIDTAPVNVTVLSENDIAKSGASNVAQLLSTEAGIHVRDLFGVGGAKASVDMGGFGATGSQNALILLNGRRLNDVDVSGANLSLIALNNVARVEIIHGSGTVLYGDNAVGGVINIVTKSGLDSSASSASITAGSFNTLRGELLARGKRGDDGWLVSADLHGSDGYRDNSGFENGALAGEWTRLNGENLWGARFDAGKEDLELPGALNEPEYETDPTTSSTSGIEHANQDQFSVEGFLNGPMVAGELAYRQKDQHAKLFGTTDATLKTLSFTPRARRTYGKHQLIAGIDLYRSELETKADFTTSINTSAADRDSYGLYLSDTVSLSPNIQVQLGWRSQRVSLDVRNRDELTGTVTPSNRADDLEGWDVTLNFTPNKQLSGYVRAARSFRAPVLDEIWSYFGGSITLLDPQKGDHWEAGARYNWTAATTFDLTLARIDNEREIGFDLDTFSNVNLDPTRHDNLRLGLTTQVTDRTRIRASYSYQDANFRSGTHDGKAVPEVPESRAALNIDHTLQNKWVAIFGINYVGERYFGNDFANVGKRMPDYTWVTAALDGQEGPWRMRLSIDNLFDEDTADQGFYNSFAANPYYYYPLPERSYALRVTRDW